MCDFLNDELPDGQRVPYKLIRRRFLGRHYIYCVSKFNLVKRTCQKWKDNEHESAFAYDDLELSFDLPIENLMLEVFAVIIAGGRQSEEFESHYKDRICKILHGKDICSFLECLAGEELIEFREDLILLGLVQ